MKKETTEKYIEKKLKADYAKRKEWENYKKIIKIGQIVSLVGAIAIIVAVTSFAFFYLTR